jgi:ABC-type branched-subunit amino acid transport system ATPase component
LLEDVDERRADLAELPQVDGRKRLQLSLAVPVEQNLAATLALAQRIYIINNGHIVHDGPAQEIKAQPEILQRYLGV